MERRDNKTNFLVNAGLMIAIATVLSYIVIVQMPQGGTVTAASMVPIFLIAYKYGFKRGVMTGVVYGVLQAVLQASAVVHPVQLLLDYPIAFGFLGIAGIFSPKILDRSLGKGKKAGYIAAGTLIGVLGRFICHILSGAIFFKEYAGLENPWIYSAVYNLSYLLPEFIITVIVTVLLLSTFERFLYK